MERQTAFVKVFEFTPDSSKAGRVLYTTQVGNIFMSQYVIEPGVTVRSHYHRRARNIFYVEEGRVRCRFEHVTTKEFRMFEVHPGKHVIHIPPYVAHEFANIGKTPAVLVIFCDKKPRSGDDWEYTFNQTGKPSVKNIEII